ncbi:Rpn family recombination-promoting nuclease/putative transposase [Ruania halotolerans]|uniref:Rpn family recombination-promoting nuclease/putative transposase n=1 Tax=Ruania halotolerans TaxID=2897773 RepID=UPI001E61A66C|nr:Rpn family recombination-promoting nuclease/putative transposase [Ruania halotolerans]UFU07373.1 Rpn family recombination-promoting nuclease/putative transposase [Ruania halotolerans]
MANRSEHPNPHDAMFRAVVQEPVHAASVLAAALPEQVTGRLDLDELRLELGSFVDEDMRERHTDLLFSTRLNGNPALVYVLVEHQSSPDQWMAFGCWTTSPASGGATSTRDPTQVVAGNHTTSPTGNTSTISSLGGDESRLSGSLAMLPPVLPVVIYRGTRRWNAPTSLDGLYEPVLEEALGDLLPRLQYVLHDLTGVDVQELLAAPLTPAARVAFAMLSYAPRQQRLDRVLADFTPDVLELISTRADRTS